MVPTSAALHPRRFALATAWLVCALLAAAHQAVVRDYLGLLEEAAGPVAERTTPLVQLVPGRYADTQMWVRHALAAQEAGELRTRFTAADNAPEGRAVHWASPVAWLLRGAAALEGGGVAAMERAVRWFNLPLLLAAALALSAWVARRAGTAAGAVLALGFVGHPRVHAGFAPGNVDHHGLLAAAVLALLLGMVAAIAGPPGRPARRAATFSALGGAVGMWLGAATMLPVIAIAGSAGLLVALRRGTAGEADGGFDPAVWRRWGAVGAAASFGFYLVEYAPAHFGVRLEVNHPLYAAFWWGGAEVVATIGAWGSVRPPLWRAVGAAVAVLGAPATILLGGRDVFVVGDPFVGALRHFVAEGKSLPALAAQFGFRSVASDLASCLLLGPAAWVAWRRRDAAGRAVAFATLVAAALTAMAVLEMRWWSNVGPAHLAVLVAALGVVPEARRGRWAAGLGVLLLLPALGRVAGERAENRQGRVTATDLAQPLYRDLAAALRRDRPEGGIVLLASPNASAGIGYYGRFATLGTLYWENTAGLRAAAEIFGAATEAEAERAVRARRVTHVAYLSTANFLAEYRQLRGGPAAEARDTFGHRLAAGFAGARWLQPIPYRRPPGLQGATEVARLYRVAFDQTEAERLYFTAVAQAAEGNVAAAEATLAEAVRQTPAAEHATLFGAAGAAFYDFGADALAVQALRRVRGSEATLAWILATTRETALRDGRAALALIEPVVRAAPGDPGVLSAYAAALAEDGRWAEAVAAAERALAAADPASAPLLAERLAAYRQGRPWRP